MNGYSPPRTALRFVVPGACRCGHKLLNLAGGDRDSAAQEQPDGRLTPADEQAAVRALRTFERRCFIVDVDRAVLARVRRPFPLEPIRTLDAVHLATTELLGEAPPLVTMVTRDDRVRSNARALGYMVE